MDDFRNWLIREAEATFYSRPALVGDALYLATARRLYLIATQPLKQ